MTCMMRTVKSGSSVEELCPREKNTHCNYCGKDLCWGCADDCGHCGFNFCPDPCLKEHIHQEACMGFMARLDDEIDKLEEMVSRRMA